MYLILLALPRGASEVNRINNLAKGLGKNSVIDLQSVSEERPKPLSQEALRPDLIVDSGDLPATARELRDSLASSGKFFDRGMPVKIVRPADGGPPLSHSADDDQGRDRGAQYVSARPT